MIDTLHDETVFGMPAHTAFAVYHLMKGGVESPLELETLTGVKAYKTDFQKLFLECDQRWHRMSKTPANLLDGKSIRCRLCLSVCTQVPCQECDPGGCRCDWRKASLAYVPDTNGRRCPGSSKSSYHDRHPAEKADRQYHGHNHKE
jgi:hypothetical protein